MSPLASTTLRLGDRAPEFTLPDLDGRPFELADVLQGGTVLLSFAPGVWSQTTRRQIDEFEAAHEELERLGVIPLIIVTQRGRDARRSLQAHLFAPDRDLTQPSLSFPILADAERKVARDYGVYRAITLDGINITRPSVFLIDPGGLIAFAYVGRNDTDVPDMTDLVRLVRSLAHPRVIPFDRELDVADRRVEVWNTDQLPRISRAPAYPQLSEPAPSAPVPALPMSGQDAGTDGAQLDQGAESPLAPDDIIPLGPPQTNGTTKVAAPSAESGG